MTEKRTGGVSVPPEVLALLDPEEAERARQRRLAAARQARWLAKKQQTQQVKQITLLVPVSREADFRALAKWSRENPDQEFSAD
ncbi:MAG: hypothetical protein H7842_02520 [Gammaproteobacteria bacterium SHHR-1]